jgi:hypothetical protein
MTNFLWALLGFFIGGMIGVIIMTLLQIGRESDKDFDRLPSVWVGFVEGEHHEPLLIRMIRGYGIDVYMLNATGDYEHVSKLPYSFTSRTKLTEYIKRSGPFLTRSDKEELKKEDEP